jgi:hypothetical protein
MFRCDNTGIGNFYSIANIVALLMALSSVVFAQSSPLTVQPSTGRVGVGTTTPNSKIEAKGTDVGVSVMNNAGTQNYYIGIKDSDSNKFYLGRGRDPSQGIAPAITVDTSDKVGIGTTSPTEKLDVSGTVKATAFIGDGSQLTNLPAGGGNALLNKVTTNTSIPDTTTAETTLYSFTIPGGTLGTNNTVRLTLRGTVSISDGYYPIRMRIKYGATTLATETILGTSDWPAAWQLVVELSGDGAANSQLMHAVGMIRNLSAVPEGEQAVQWGSNRGEAIRVMRGTSAIDSNTAQSLLVTGQWMYYPAGAGQSITVEYAMLEKLS